MAMVTASGRAIDARINVTPMIDVLLVLLILYMVITPVPSKGEGAQIPQKTVKTQAPPLEPAIVLQLLSATPSGAPRIRINSEDISWSDLPDRLATIAKASADSTIFVEANRELDFQFIASAIDQAHGAGFRRVGLITAP